MTDAAAIAGSYADFKLIKSRSVAQVIVEVPIERAEAFLKVFGVPQPGAERPVALALLNVQKPAEQEKPKVPWVQMSYAQRSGILRNDKRFQGWLGVNTAEDAAEHIRRKCGVESCAKLDDSYAAQQKFETMESMYRRATGQMAEMRS